MFIDTLLFQVIAALRESGLESSNLILGIDFTKSNEWTGDVRVLNIFFLACFERFLDADASLVERMDFDNWL